MKRIAENYFDQYESDRLEYFLDVFDTSYHVLHSQESADELTLLGAGALQADSGFGDGMSPAALVIWITSAIFEGLENEGFDTSKLPEIASRVSSLTELPNKVERIAEELRNLTSEIQSLRLDRSIPPSAGSVGKREATSDLPASAPAPVDLLWRIETRYEPGGGLILEHSFRFPSKRVKFPGFEAQSPRLPESDLRRLERRLFTDLEQALRKKTPTGDFARSEDIGPIVQRLGAELADKLVPGRVRDLFQLQRENIDSVLLITDDPGIPWELARLPNGEAGSNFLACMVDLGRWSTRQNTDPTGLFRIGRLLALEAAEVEGWAKLDAAENEKDVFESLLETYPSIDGEILSEPSVSDFLDRLKATPPDLLHFAGHGDYDPDDPDKAILVLADESLIAHQLDRDLLHSIAEVRPLIFLNACRTGQSPRALTGVGGWPDRWIRVGRCGALLCPQWSVRSSVAAGFSEGFYGRLQNDPEMTLGRAVREIRNELIGNQLTDPTPLAYAFYGHPNARVVFGRGPRAKGSVTLPARITTPKDHPLQLPEPEWDAELSPPAALLRAEYGIVKFHLREDDLEDLRTWSHSDRKVSVRLFTGPGGIGKTRLAKELCLELRDQSWLAGFVDGEPSADRIWKALSSHRGSSMVVIDYAESRTELIIPLLQMLRKTDGCRFRVLLLARAALDWWTELKSAGDGLDELLQGPATRRIALRPLAPGLDERHLSYDFAIESFAANLGRQVSDATAEDLEGEIFDRVLMIHMRALAALHGNKGSSEDAVLDFALGRERRFWKRRLNARKLPQTLERALSRSMCLLTLVGGADSESEAVEIVRDLSVFEGRPTDVVVEVVRLLRDCYPGTFSEGTRWIEPLMPDLLGEHLIEKELEQDPDEILDIALGPGGDESRIEETES